MDIEKQNKRLKNALELTLALDASYDEGRKKLEVNGFDFSNRFDYPATQFVADYTIKTLELCKE